MLSPVRTRVVYVAAAACVVFFLGVSTAVSTARAQSDVADAPWQAHPCEGRYVPPPDTPCDGDCPCGIGHGRGHARAAGCEAGCGEESCDEECNPATDWLRMFEPCGRFSFRGEYLAWWTKSTDLPPLVSTGVLPGAMVLFSGSDGDPGLHSGGRFTLGYWLTPGRETGLDVTYTFLGNTAATFEPGH